jgi:hypothetical protein
MVSSQQQTARDGVLSTLDAFIQTLNFARDSCGIPPAQIAFGSASVLLTMIRVYFLLLCNDGILIRVYLGHDGQRSGLCRPWAGLWRCMPDTLQEIGGETAGPTQPVCAGCNWGAEHVSQTDNPHTE